MQYVYTFTDKNNKVIHVGQSLYPKRRYYDLVVRPPRNRSQGYFHGQDLQLNIIQSFNTKKEALELEGILKKANRIEHTESTRSHKGAMISGAIRKTCPHCSKEMDVRNYARWHGDKCKLINV